MKPPFKFSWELVTPAMAKEWLKKNAKNRNLRKATVATFANDMARKAWSPTHQGIAFELGGGLIDGQHRLAAIVRSGCSVAFLICRDVPKRVEGVKADVMDAIDRGNTRSIADVLKLAHGLKVDANLVAACCVMITHITLGHRESDRRARKLSLSQTLGVLERYRASLKFVCENRPSTIGLRPAPVCAAIAFAHAVEPVRTEEFYLKFGTGIGIDADSPVLTARNYYINEPPPARGSIKHRVARAEGLLHVIYCFIHSLPLPRMPKEGLAVHASYFREKQPENIAAIEQIFPSLDEPVVSPDNWKPNAAVNELLQGKDVSDRIHGRVAKMKRRIQRGELAAAR